MQIRHFESAPHCAPLAPEMAIQQRSTVLIDAAVCPASLLEIGKGTHVQGPTGDRPTLLCVLSGTARLMIEGEAVITVRTGSAVLIPARVNAMIGQRGGRRKDETVASATLLPCGELPRTGTYCAGGKPLRALVAAVTYQAPATGKHRVLDIDLTAIGNLRLAFSAMCAEIEQQRPGVRLLAAALLKTCLVHLHRRHFPDVAGEEGASRTAMAIAAMRANPGASHNVDALARDAGMSRSSFARHFQRETGTSPMVLLSRIRLAHAAAMLHAAATPIKVVAAECGFASRSHFSRAFREAYGVDPSAFRREGRRTD